jgi:hypothetical protein
MFCDLVGSTALSAKLDPEDLRGVIATYHRFARLWRDQGKRTDARDLLAPVYGWFTEGFETPVLKARRCLTSWRKTIHPMAGQLSNARQGHDLVRRRDQPGPCRTVWASRHHEVHVAPEGPLRVIHVDLVMSA